MVPNGEWATNPASRLGPEHRGTRIPGVSNTSTVGSVSGAPPRRFDNRISESSTQGRPDDDSSQHLLGWQKDGGLPPRPPAPNFHPWIGPQGWRGDSHFDQRRERAHQPRVDRAAGRPDGRVDSYIPRYEGQNNRPRNRGDDSSRHEPDSRDGKPDVVHGRRDHARDHLKRRSQSPPSRERERNEDPGFNLYRR